MTRRSKSKRKRTGRQEARSQLVEGTATTLVEHTNTRVRRFGVWAICSLLLAIGGAYVHFGRPMRIKIGANLSHFEGLSLSYGSSTRDRISPLCGCMKEQEAEIWRGVTFASRNI